MARNSTYEITINGEKKVFNSEMELDTFLDNYVQNMVVDNVDATLQVDQQQVTVDKISEAIKKYKSLATEFEITNEDGEKEIALKLDKSDYSTKVMIGGAVVTQEYADNVGANAYAPDGVEAVEIAKKLINK